MKALVCDSYGSVDCIKFREFPEPEIGPHDILVRVRAAGVIFTDILFAEGKYQVKPQLPFVPGCEVSGDVLAAGLQVTRFKPGDRIMSMAINFGGFAERVAIPAWLPTPLPQLMSYEAGAAVMSSFGTAQHALRQRAQLRAGEVLVITGAAGGTGSAAIQIAKQIGARVIAACSTQQKAEFCKSIGADYVIDSQTQDLKLAIKNLTDGRGADVVIETVGGDTFDMCSRSMAYNGRLLVVGFASGRIPSLPANLPLIKAYSVIGVHWLTFVKAQPTLHAENMEELLHWLQQGAVAPIISSTIALRDGVAALRQLANRLVCGKLILTP